MGNPNVIKMLTTEANAVQSADQITKPKALLTMSKALRAAVMNDDHVCMREAPESRLPSRYRT